MSERWAVALGRKYVVLVMQYVAMAIAGAGLMLLSLRAQRDGQRAAAMLWGMGLVLLVVGNASREAGPSGAALAGATVGLLAALAERRPQGSGVAAGASDGAQPAAGSRPR